MRTSSSPAASNSAIYPSSSFDMRYATLWQDWIRTELFWQPKHCASPPNRPFTSRPASVRRPEPGALPCLHGLSTFPNRSRIKCGQSRCSQSPMQLGPRFGLKRLYECTCSLDRSDVRRKMFVPGRRLLFQPDRLEWTFSHGRSAGNRSAKLRRDQATYCQLLE